MLNQTLAAFCLCLALPLAADTSLDEIKSDFAAQEAAAPKLEVYDPPVLDGDDSDPAWGRKSAVAFSLPGGVKGKFMRDDRFAYVLVKFPADSEAAEHKLWNWDAASKCYVPGPEREASLAVAFRSDKRPDMADVWLWRAARTNPGGRADDMAATFGKAGTELRHDQGRLPWRSRFLGDFAGAKLPRYYQITPTGSAADVKAGGKWLDGHWTVELRRRLATGNPDDLDLAKLDGMGILVVPNPSGAAAILAAPVTPLEAGR